MRRQGIRGKRGVTLIEVMISMTILLIGLLGMMRLQILGITSNQGARAQTTAGQILHELAAGLQQLPYDDARLTPDYSTPTAPPSLGPLLGANGTLSTGSFHTWDDATTAMPGVRLDSSLERDPGNGTQPLYQRRWTVWAPNTLTRIVAVSVIYRERAIPTPRELIMYVSNSDPSSAFQALK